MKKYGIFDFKVVKVKMGSNEYYLICKYNKFKDTYIEFFTKEKIKISDKSCVEPLSNYCAAPGREVSKYFPAWITKRGLLITYIKINNLNLVKKEENKEEKNSCIVPENNNKSLEEATLDFFPKTGHWYSGCFKKSKELNKENLPCHLRDDEWLAKMLKKDQNLSYMSNSEVLNYVKTSEFFKEKRHEYELEIVKWQIKWISNCGENWITDSNYGGEFVYFNPLVDLGVRKGVVDTLLEIGMDKDVIEEGLEKFSDLWREQFMERAFKNEYESSVFWLFDNKIPPAKEEHKQNWLKYRRYEYYQRHKDSVDLYGEVLEDMLMNDEEVNELKTYLDAENQKRKSQIDEFEKTEKESSKKLVKSIWH